MNEQTTKTVIVIDETLPIGIIANTAAILGITLGKHVPDIVGSDVADSAGQNHLGITTTPVPILKGNLKILTDLRHLLYQSEFSDLLAVDFTNIAQSCI